MGFRDSNGLSANGLRQHGNGPGARACTISIQNVAWCHDPRFTASFLLPEQLLLRSITELFHLLSFQRSFFLMTLPRFLKTGLVGMCCLCVHGVPSAATLELVYFDQPPHSIARCRDRACARPRVRSVLGRKCKHHVAFATSLGTVG